MVLASDGSGSCIRVRCAEADEQVEEADKQAVGRRVLLLHRLGTQHLYCCHFAAFPQVAYSQLQVVSWLKSILWLHVFLCVFLCHVLAEENTLCYEAIL